MVMPERLMPGKSASACAAPMASASPKCSWSSPRSRRPRRSATQRMAAPAISSRATIARRSRKYVSKKDSSVAPSSAAGTTETTRSQARRRSGSPASERSRRLAAPAAGAAAGRAGSRRGGPPACPRGASRRTPPCSGTGRPSRGPGHQDEMRRRRDGQELGESLDDPDEGGLEDGVHRWGVVVGRARGPTGVAVLLADEERREHQRDRRQQLDQHVQRRAGGVLERIADRVADDGRRVRVACPCRGRCRRRPSGGPASMNFLALSQAPPPLLRTVASRTPAMVPTISRPATAS